MKYARIGRKGVTDPFDDTLRVVVHPILVMFPIQIAAFLMTLVRKNIITAATWHYIYAGSLLACAFMMPFQTTYMDDWDMSMRDSLGISHDANMRLPLTYDLPKGWFGDVVLQIRETLFNFGRDGAPFNCYTNDAPFCYIAIACWFLRIRGVPKWPLFMFLLALRILDIDYGFVDGFRVVPLWDMAKVVSSGGGAVPVPAL